MKKFKLGCSYQVKPKHYNDFEFAGDFWHDNPQDTIFTVTELSIYGSVCLFDKNGDFVTIATSKERKLCKRIKDKPKENTK